MRSFWKGDSGQVAELATRLTGSSDLFSLTRRPTASINFITCHDGFSLEDLVSYNQKHNEANGENNRDGNSDNLSWNCGKEGPVRDVRIRELRARQKRNFMASLCLSLGVPMLRGGDELCQSHRGNNNPYCQDNELTWLNWVLDNDQRKFLEFVSQALAFRKGNPVFRRREFYNGLLNPEAGTKDLVWFRPDAMEMTDQDWSRFDAHSLAMCLLGSGIRELGEHGERIHGDTLFTFFNSYSASVRYVLPQVGYFRGWELVMETAEGTFPNPLYVYKPRDTIDIPQRSIVVLRAVP